MKTFRSFSDAAIRYTPARSRRLAFAGFALAAVATSVLYQSVVAKRTALAAPIAAAQAKVVAPALPKTANAGAPFGVLPIVDEVDCAASPPADPNRYVEGPGTGVSRVETLLGRACRVLPNEGPSRYFAYRIGAGKNLKPGQAYLLTVEFPDDKPRSLFISNRGCETQRGVVTGSALGDSLLGYTNPNAESIRLPQSGRYQTWRSLFFLHDRFPGLSQPRGDGPRPDLPPGGFWVVVSQPKAQSAPGSEGAAVARIRLFAAPKPDALAVKINYPPSGLPRRHLYWREEMSDGVIGSQKPDERGVSTDAVWFENKARTARYLGMDTLCKDLLEFGYNQGWDAGPSGDWYVNPPFKKRWEEIIGVAKRYDLNLLPYYEYAGSVGPKGLGTQKRVLPLKGALPYTQIPWTENFYADVTDPDTLDDATRLLDATITRYKGQGKFVGAWFRPRPSHMPISFADAALARFARDANQNAVVTRDQMKNDDVLRARYYAWWFGKRRDFIVALSAHLRQSVGPDAIVLLTTDSSEPGRSLIAPLSQVVTDDPDLWKTLLTPQPNQKIFGVISLAEVAKNSAQLTALTSPTPTYGEWEWQHADPQADPANYRDTPGALLTFTVNRAYMVASPTAFDAFRTPSGLALAYHYSLNEDTMDPALGYFVADVERIGPYSMLTEARALAHGDPRFIGYLTSNSFNRGFPEYARAFNQAFLALPALPSHVVKDASPDAEIVVRAIPTPKNGVYYSVVNTGLLPKRAATIRLPLKPSAPVTDLVTQKNVARNRNGVLTFDLPPCSVRALHSR